MKLTTVAMFGAGYVLGTRAGRQRYEQLVVLGRRLADEVDGPTVRRSLDSVSARLEEFASNGSSRLADGGDRRRAQASR